MGIAEVTRYNGNGNGNGDGNGNGNNDVAWISK